MSDPERTISQEELAALPGIFDSDEGTAEQFVLDGKLRFRLPGAQGDGVPLRRQAENIYALDQNNEVHFLVRDGRAIWGSLYAGGLMLDAKRRMR